MLFVLKEIEEVTLSPVAVDQDQFPSKMSFPTKATPLVLSQTSTSSLVAKRHEMEQLEMERDTLSQRVESLTAEVERLRAENAKHLAFRAQHEVPPPVATESVFTLKSKMDDHQRLSLMLKERCNALHHQLTADLTQFARWHCIQSGVQWTVCRGVLGENQQR